MREPTSGCFLFLAQEKEEKERKDDNECRRGSSFSIHCSHLMYYFKFLSQSSVYMLAVRRTYFGRKSTCEKNERIEG